MLARCGVRVLLGALFVFLVGLVFAAREMAAQQSSTATTVSQEKQVSPKKGTDKAKPKAPNAARTTPRPRLQPVQQDQTAECAAQVAVSVSVPKVSLQMKTEEPAVWYSLVDTIPPVGHTASVTIKPVRLLSNGREVGTLDSGVVKFREVVKDVTLESSDMENERRLAGLLAEMKSTDDAQLERLAPLPAKPYVVPAAGVQVMRARLEETYTIHGIGKDTVELHGWIAVRHYPARPASGESTVTWNTAVMDTEFVGLDLKGESELFGPIYISLDTERPVLGQVGRIEIPELARIALRAELRKHNLAESRRKTPGQGMQD